MAVSCSLKVALPGVLIHVGHRMRRVKQAWYDPLAFIPWADSESAFSRRPRFFHSTRTLGTKLCSYRCSFGGSESRFEGIVKLNLAQDVGLQEIHDERDRKLEEARKRRQARR